MADPGLAEFESFAALVEVVEDEDVGKFWHEAYLAVGKDIHVLALLYYVGAVYC